MLCYLVRVPSWIDNGVTELEKLQQVVAGADQGPLAVDLLQARSRNCRKPLPCLIWPKIGSWSTICAASDLWGKDLWECVFDDPHCGDRAGWYGLRSLVQR